MEMSRRGFLKAGVSLGAAILLPSTKLLAKGAPLLQKKIPSSGESVPIIGIGTARRYEEIKTEAEKAPLRETLRQFKELGGKVIDSSPTYGTAETVIGDLAAELKIRDALFIATKVSTSGREAGLAQLERSFKLLRTPKIDLIAVHNIRDTRTQLRALSELKQAGRVRYAGDRKST